MKSTIIRVALTAALTSAALGCAAPVRDSESDLPVRIEHAETRADHDAIGAHFAKEAARAREGAASHRRAARAYAAMRSGEHGNADMAAHCNSLADLYETIADDFDALARGHKGMAAHAEH